MLNLANPLQAGAPAQQNSLFTKCLNPRPVREKASLPRSGRNFANVRAEQVLNPVNRDGYDMDMEVISPSSTFRTHHATILERPERPAAPVTTSDPHNATETDSSKHRKLQSFRFQRTVTRPAQQVEPITRDQLAHKVQAIILAGGESSIPVADHRALAAVPLGGSNLSLVDVPINSLITSGINKMYVLAQYNSHTLINHVARNYPPRFSSARNESYVDVITCNQTTSSKSWYRGAAEAVARNIQEFFQRGGDLAEYFVIASGSALFDVDFLGLIQEHQERGADITLVTTCVSKEQAKRLGVVMADTNDRLTHFAEKPAPEILDQLEKGTRYTTAGQPFEASMGLYIFKRDVLFDLLSFPEVIHFGRDVIPAALSCNYSVVTAHHEGFWKDISCLRDYYDASMTLTAPSPPLNLVNMFGNTIRPMAQPPAKFHNSMIDSCLVGDGVLVQGSTVTRSVIGNNTYIANGCNISDTLLMGNEVFPGAGTLHGIGENTVITRAVVDSNASIGKNVAICNREGISECNRREEGFVIQDGIVAVLKNAVIPDGMVI